MTNWRQIFSYKIESEPFKKGDRVRSSQFGLGVVDTVYHNKGSREDSFMKVILDTPLPHSTWEQYTLDGRYLETTGIGLEGYSKEVSLYHV